MAYNVQDEVWAEYVVGCVFLLIRLYARHKIVGFQNFSIDDLFTFLGLLFYTAVTAEAYKLNFIRTPIGLTTETAELLTPEDVAEMTVGAKLLFTGWFMYISFLWSLKSILITLYFRMAESLPREMRMVKLVTVYVAAAYLVCILNHLCLCTPVEKSWQVKPYPGDQCTQRNLNYYVIASMNISTDIAIMILPLPIVARANLSSFRRALLALLFSSGIFIMICTVLRAYYSLKSISSAAVAIGWISREMMVACVAVSAPAIKPLFTGVPLLRGSSFGNPTKGPGYNGNSQLVTIGGSTPYIEMNSKVGAKSKKTSQNWQVSRGDSEEDIMGRRSNENKEGIQVTTEFAVGVVKEPPSPTSINKKDTVSVV